MSKRELNQLFDKDEMNAKEMVDKLNALNKAYYIRQQKSGRMVPLNDMDCCIITIIQDKLAKW